MEKTLFPMREGLIGRFENGNLFITASVGFGLVLITKGGTTLNYKDNYKDFNHEAAESLDIETLWEPSNQRLLDLDTLEQVVKNQTGISKIWQRPKDEIQEEQQFPSEGAFQNKISVSTWLEIDGKKVDFNNLDPKQRVILNIVAADLGMFGEAGKKAVQMIQESGLDLEDELFYAEDENDGDFEDEYSEDPFDW